MQLKQSVKIRLLIVAANGLAVLACHDAYAGEPTAYERILKEFGSPKPFKPKSVDTDSITKRSDEDVRRQKEEAADSLNKTLKDIDERSRTRALEDGRAVIVQ